MKKQIKQHFQTHDQFKNWHYGNNHSLEAQSKTSAFTIGTLTLYFSFRTLIAFQEKGEALRVIKNYWQKTTGHHLNVIQNLFGSLRGGHIDPDERLNAQDFRFRLDALLKKYHLTPEPPKPQESPTFQLYIQGQADGDPYKAGSYEEALENALEANGITITEIDPEEKTP